MPAEVWAKIKANNPSVPNEELRARNQIVLKCLPTTGEAGSTRRGCGQIVPLTRLGFLVLTQAGEKPWVFIARRCQQLTRVAKETRSKYTKGSLSYDMLTMKLDTETDDGQAAAGGEAEGVHAATGEEGQRAKRRCGGSLDQRGVAPEDIRVVWIRSDDGAEEINEKELDRLDPHEVLNPLNTNIAGSQGRQDDGAVETEASDLEAEESETEEPETDQPGIQE